MSLKKFLDSPNSKKFKESIPNLKKAFHDIENGNPYTKMDIVCEPPLGYQPQDVGTAYDWLFRAWVQRLNNDNAEGIEFDNDVLKSGLKSIQLLGILENFEEFESLVKSMWSKRVKFIMGEEVAVEEMLKLSLVFAGVEDVYRGYSRYEYALAIGEKIKRDFFNPTDSNMKDLGNMLVMTEKNSNIFKRDKNKMFVMNPVVGQELNHLVGGADGDLIVNNCFIDIKTTKDFGYKSKHIYQLISYYLMSQENLIYAGKIDSIGIYHTRFGKLYIAKIDDIEKTLNESKTSFAELEKTFRDCFI